MSSWQSRYAKAEVQALREALKWRQREEEWEEKAEVRALREALKWRQKEEEWEEKEAHLKEEVEALQIALTEVTAAQADLDLLAWQVSNEQCTSGPPFLRKKDITPEISNNQFFFFDVGCFLFSKKGRKRALACVAHQINKFYVRTACFFEGVIFCGTLLR